MLPDFYPFVTLPLTVLVAWICAHNEMHKEYSLALLA